MTSGIAIVGMACLYPDARSPSELWENVLAQRRAFRTMPDERLRLVDYLSTDRNAPDRLYSTNAAVIAGYEFDRAHFCIAGSTYRATDPAHWLALDIASLALDDAGFIGGDGLPRETTGVFLGNTLTGEVSRANSLRLRWPYVRRVIETSLSNDVPAREDLLEAIETSFKEPFPAIGEDSLAGGLSNTIAGRICNYFGLQGGGYTVDGACASSLLAVANACSALTAGDLDLALAGGVDLSLDPFELVGFAKAGALATDEMRVYDARSNGFWPGEGCGFVVLMRKEQALAQGRDIYAVIKGWGISSDGRGGITRPEIEGQLLAIRRAYARAGFGIETVGYFEGHGTGTSVGDTVELKALSRARRETKVDSPSAVIGSIKANIGHTKAAAGIAGLIKTALALNAEILPPTTGCERPHEELLSRSPALRVLKKAESWPKEQALRAGVSAMGFGGINAHVVMESHPTRPRSSMTVEEQRTLMSSAQDTELLLLGARDLNQLRNQVDHLLNFAAKLSCAELSDLAAHLATTLDGHAVRAALIAATPASLATSLERLKKISSRETIAIDLKHSVFFSRDVQPARIGFLFPGQGSPLNLDGGALRRRFDFIEELYDQARLGASGDHDATSNPQPAILTAAIAGLRVLDRLNVSACVGLGHSLGELAAFHWAGALDEQSVLRIARVRGQAMTQLRDCCGAMASIGADERAVLALLNGEQVVIAGLNAPTQTVISGQSDHIDAVIARARAKNLAAIRLSVPQAFHSPLLSDAAPILAEYLKTEEFKPLHHTVFSTISGRRLPCSADLPDLLYQQITSPVRFMEAVTEAEKQKIDLWLEVGPGEVLRGIMTDLTKTPVISLDSGGESFRGLLEASAAAYVLGLPVNHRTLFEGRYTRSFDMNWRPKFFVNPCELRPSTTANADVNAEVRSDPLNDTHTVREPQREEHLTGCNSSPLELVMQLVAERAELPVSAINPHSQLLGDLHLNSITVGQLVGEAARCLNLPAPVSPTDFADARVADLAQALEEQIRLGRTGASNEPEELASGIDSWVRPFRVELKQCPRATHQSSHGFGKWTVLAAFENSFLVYLRAKLAELKTDGGVIVCLPGQANEQVIKLLLQGAELVQDKQQNRKFLLVQSGMRASAFARTLHLERPHVTTCVVTVPWFNERSAEWVVSEALAAHGFVEAHYDEHGQRFEPVVRRFDVVDDKTDLGLSKDDVLLVTGGGKGITAECALALAKESGVKLVLMGRADPKLDGELQTNLCRMIAAGIDFQYISADVTDEGRVHAAIQQVEHDVGPVTGILHGAGINVPQLISTLDEEAFGRTLSVKFQGARNVLAAINPAKLKLLITFGSIISRTGLPGEADYGVANEWLTHLTEHWKLAHPHCRCLSLEWTVWSGAGMGERLGRTDRLLQQGITPISSVQGVAILLSLLSQELPSVPVVVMGRFRDLPTLKIERPDLPFLRFVEETKVYFPGTELIVDADISPNTDLYLNDHILQGNRLLPAVMGLEAMAQVASGLITSTKMTAFESVSFARPVLVPETGTVRVRLAALVRTPGVVEVALRSVETEFKVNHFRALCRFEKTESDQTIRSLCHPDELPPLLLTPDRDLYDDILFQTGRFQKIRNYRFLGAKECIAELTANENRPWFSQYLPGDLLLGNPGTRDAALHAVQACIPHKTVVPVACERLSFEMTPATDTVFVHARERQRDGDSFTFDLEIVDHNGQICERWKGLQFRAVAERSVNGPWVESLLGPYFERKAQQLIPGASMSVALIRRPAAPRQSRSNEAIQLALGEKVEIVRLPDGKPCLENGLDVSAAHAGDLTLGVAGHGPLGCDLAYVTQRPDIAWHGLLGGQRQRLASVVVQDTGESYEVAATRVWTGLECLKKIGAMIDAPLFLAASNKDGWVLFSSGRVAVATFRADIRDQNRSLVLAVAAENT